MLTGINLLIPEIILILGVMTTLMVSAYYGRINGMHVSCYYSKFFVGLALLFVVILFSSQGFVFDKQFLKIDIISQYSKILILSITFMTLIIGSFFLKQSDYLHQEHRGDIFPTMLLSVVGMCVMVSSYDLMSFYLGLELQSLALYILIAFKRDCPISVEASLKYLVLGALGSGLLLFGISLIYGALGGVHFSSFAALDVHTPEYILFVVGIAFIIIALLFKLSAVPFHMWTPDVYQGSASFITAFIASAPKIAIIIMLLRLIDASFELVFDQIQQMISLSALLSLFLGSIMAIRQKSIFRMIAYSTITHMGYILLAFIAYQGNNHSIILEYTTIYVISSFGLLTLIGTIMCQGKVIDEIKMLSGLSSQRPKTAALVTIFMLSMAGIPPLAGFFVKFNVLYSLVQSDMVYLALLAVIASLISAFYYLRVIKVMYFDSSECEYDDHISKTLYLCATFCAIIIATFVFYPTIPFIQ